MTSAVQTRFDLMAFPHNKVYKRLTLGAEQNLWAFYQTCVTGSAPPGSTMNQL